jgi:hypothetical protein
VASYSGQSPLWRFVTLQSITRCLKKISFNDYKLTTSGFIKTSFKNVYIENHQTVRQWCKYIIHYPVNYIFHLAVSSGGLSCCILTHCCQIVSSMIAKSHDTNYKILGANEMTKIFAGSPTNRELAGSKSSSCRKLMTRS